jgi:hypothetical protein
MFTQGFFRGLKQTGFSKDWMETPLIHQADKPVRQGHCLKLRDLPIFMKSI